MNPKFKKGQFAAAKIDNLGYISGEIVSVEIIDGSVNYGMYFDQVNEYVYNIEESDLKSVSPSFTTIMTIMLLIILLIILLEIIK